MCAASKLSAGEAAVALGRTAGGISCSDEVDELTHLSWADMDSETEEQLTANRMALVSALRASEKAYILERWQPKERRVVHCYTKLYSNLVVNSSQRGESYHVPMREITSGLVSLEEFLPKD